LHNVVRIPARLAILLIRFYQLTLGRLVGDRCRFHPTCSRYAVEAIETYGLVAGGARAGWRLMRCGPWTAGGIDPVRRPEVSRG
jgi:putative membrane protein insertion efficiency factor